MPASGEKHPSPAQLVAFGQGRLSIAAAEDVERHLSGCDTCCTSMLNMTCDDQLAELARAVHANRETGEDTGESSLAMTQNESRSNPGMSSGFANAEKASQPLSPRGVDHHIPVELRNHARYGLRRVLGRGGMGVVWLAEHLMMQRLVAVKVIGSKFTAERSTVARFYQEVRAAAKLRHPNIVTAFDAEQAGDLHFLVMEYIDGLSLSEHVQKNGPLPIDMARDVIRHVCAGLGYAHRQGMIHRDIKPQNLMLGRDGIVRILDFGLARLTTYDAPVSLTAKTEVRLTGVGMVLGTPDYMSPEQATDAGSVDARTDIYSLGCTLFFLLTGRAPFEGCSFEEMLISGIRTRMAAVRELRPDVPASLVRLIEKMTAENPNDRAQSAEDVIRELDAAHKTVSHSDGSRPPVPIEDSSQQVTSARAKKQAPRAAQKPSPRSTQHPPVARSRLSERPADRGRPGRPPWYRPSFRRVAASFAAISVIGVIIATMSGMFRSPDGSEETLTVAEEPSSAMNKDRKGASLPPGPRQPNPTESTPPGKSNTPPSPTGTTPPSATAATASQAPRSGTPETGFRVLFIVPATDFYWPDVGPVTRLLTESGCRVDMASWKSRATMLNNKESEAKIPLLLTDVSPDDYDALIIGGGPGIFRLIEPCEEADQAESLTKQMFASGRLVAAFNAGPGVLAKMKLLDGVKATGNQLIHQHVRDNYGVTLENSVVEVSGRIITGRDSKSEVIQEFVGAILRVLAARRAQP